MKRSQLIADLHAKFAARFAAEPPTTVSVADWLISAKTEEAGKWNLQDSVFALRIAEKFKVPPAQSSLYEKVEISDTSTRGLSLLASALASYPGGDLEIARQILEKAREAPAQDARSLSRLCKMAAAYPSAVTSTLAAALTRNFQVLAESGMLGTPDDLRGFLEFFAELNDPKNQTIIFKLVASDAALLKHDDALANLEISSRMPHCPGALEALRALRLSCLRCSPGMSQAQRGQLACILARIGGWNLETCGMLERKIFWSKSKLSKYDFAKLLAFTTGAVTRNFHISTKMVVAHLNEVVEGSCDALTAARTLWAIHAADLLSSSPARFSSGWSAEHAEIAVRAETKLLAMLTTLEIPTVDNLEYWVRLGELEDFAKYKFPGDGVKWARSEIRRLRLADPLYRQISENFENPAIAVLVDVPTIPVGPALMLEILKRKFNAVHVIDGLSWFSKPSSEDWAKKLDSSESSVMYDSPILVEPPINWDSDEIKIPGNAMRYSLRRANSPYLK